MNKENTEKLFNDFPELYGQKDLPINQTNMCWGFECGDGWFDIIYQLSEKISAHHNIQATQVKEKFGTLRFYTNYHDDAVEAMIAEAERKSEVTCDVCGQPGEMRSDGWLSVRCEEHK